MVNALKGVRIQPPLLKSYSDRRVPENGLTWRFLDSLVNTPLNAEFRRWLMKYAERTQSVVSGLNCTLVLRLQGSTSPSEPGGAARS